MGSVMDLFPIALAVVVVIGFLLLLSRSDAEEIRTYIEKRGGHLIEKSRKPGTRLLGLFAKVYVYEVRYQDADGNGHEATCTINRLLGTMWTGDTVTSLSARSDTAVARRLNEKLEGLRKHSNNLRP